MELVLDCEWNSTGGQLISLALVPRARKEDWFYRELILEEEIDPWVMDNVIPNLNHAEKPIWKEELAGALEVYLKQFDSVEIIADWPEDIARFCMLLITGPGQRIETPDLSFRIERIDVHGSIPHNALSDALAMRDHLFADDQRPSFLLGPNEPTEEKLLKGIENILADQG